MATRLRRPASAGPRLNRNPITGLEGTSYERLYHTGYVRDENPAVRPAGKSGKIFEDSAGRDLQPEIYAPAPGTPPHERKFRKALEPGAAAIHWGLKEQKLPAEAFAYGTRSNSKKESVSAAFEAQKQQNQSFRNDVAERVYWSTKHEPLGKGYVAGHELPEQTKDPKFHFGVPTSTKDEGKATIYPRDPKYLGEDEEVHSRYVKTHGDFAPGEMVNRKYAWPEEVSGNPHFRFGAGSVSSAAKDGQGIKDCINMDREVGEEMPKTRIVQRTLEDARHVKNDAIGRVKNFGTGKPPVPPGHAFGARSAYGGTAWECITGNYSVEEQLPDKDLGRCTKPGRRNIPQSRERVYGVPSVRFDKPAPAHDKKGLGDMTSYSNEHHMKLLINPQRFVLSGIEDDDFLLRRPKNEIHSLLTGAGYAFKDGDFDDIWGQAVKLFQDGVQCASLDAFMFVYSDWLNQAVSERNGALHLGALSAR